MERWMQLYCSWFWLVICRVAFFIATGRNRFQRKIDRQTRVRNVGKTLLCHQIWDCRQRRGRIRVGGRSWARIEIIKFAKQEKLKRVRYLKFKSSPSVRRFSSLTHSLTAFDIFPSGPCLRLIHLLLVLRYSEAIADLKLQVN